MVETTTAWVGLIWEKAASSKVARARMSQKSDRYPERPSSVL